MSTGDDEEPKTPLQTPNREPVVQPTPQSQGTAANAEFRCPAPNENTDTDKDTYILEFRQSEIIRNVKIPLLEDLQSSATCSLEDIDGSTNTNARDLRDAIKQYCSEIKETSRYMPLARALNNILAAFPPEGQGSADDRIMFHFNDSAIESKCLAEAKSTKRKLGIIAILCRVAKTLYKPHVYGTGFDDIVRAPSAFHTERKDSPENRPRMKDQDDSTRLKWLQVLQSLELKSSNRKISFDEKKKFSGSCFPAGGCGMLAEQIPIPEKNVQHNVSMSETTESTAEQDMNGNKGNGKRLSQEGVAVSAFKRQKTMSDNDTRLPPVQCVLYAAERLMCDPSITHTIHVILQDDVLRLWWYGKQGTIQSALSVEGFRVPRICLFEKLQPITELSCDAFWKAYWEIVRCHALLWKLGVAHCDISVGNMMCDSKSRGVLIDYDLASFVDEETNAASRQGCRSTGTLPFMALQLLTDEGWTGGVPRRYRHDLESFFWCLAWVCGCVDKQKENRNTSPFPDWMSGNHKECLRAKLSYTYGSDFLVTDDFAGYQPLLVDMAAYWGQFYQTQNWSKARRDNQLTEEPDFHHLQQVLGLAEKNASSNANDGVASAESLNKVPIHFPVDFLSEPLRT